MAPEVLQKQPASFASDVYAFAVTLNELATSVYPFSDCTKDNPEVHTVLEMGYGRQELAAAVATEGLRPLLPKQSPPSYAGLINACWQLDAASRPSFAEIRDSLAQMLAGIASFEKAANVPAAPVIKVYAGFDSVSDMSDQASACSASEQMDCDSASASQCHTPAPQLDGSDTPASSSESASDAAAALLGALGVAAEEVPAPSYLTVSIGGFAGIGPRDSMEDRHVVIHSLGGQEANHLAAVFDGHRGHEAADFAASHLPRALQLASTHQAHGGVQAALEEAFTSVDTAFLNEWQADVSARAARGCGTQRFPGCTALAAVIAGGRLFVANAGDSRGVVCRGGQAMTLTRDHTAALDDEQLRVLATGEKVEMRAGSWRVGEAALQVTRALGDFDLKHKGGVISVPEVTKLVLTPDDDFVILATDGLWDVIHEQEAIGLVHDTVKDPVLCAKRLVMEALSRGSRDNVTAVVMFLQPVDTLESVWSSAGGLPARQFTATYYGSRRASSNGGSGVVSRQSSAMVADEVADTY